MISSIVSIVLGVFAALITAFLYGSKKGKDKVENDNNEKIVQEINEVKKMHDKIDSMPISVKRDGLREFSRD